MFNAKDIQWHNNVNNTYILLNNNLSSFSWLKFEKIMRNTHTTNIWLKRSKNTPYRLCSARHGRQVAPVSLTDLLSIVPCGQMPVEHVTAAVYFFPRRGTCDLWVDCKTTGDSEIVQNVVRYIYMYIYNILYIHVLTSYYLAGRCKSQVIRTYTMWINVSCGI